MLRCRSKRNELCEDFSRTPSSAVFGEAALSAAGEGMLTFAATPWCNLTIDGAAVGATPIVNMHLPAGRHLAVCENPELHVTRTVVVEILAGETSRQRISLQ